MPWTNSVAYCLQLEDSLSFTLPHRLRILIFPQLSTLAKDTLNVNNLFAEFAAAKCNLSSADIAQMCKTRPSLGRLKTLENVEQVLDMLKRYGCSDHQIAIIAKRQPELLSINAERILEPKLRLLEGFGIRGEGLASTLTLSPRTLTSSLKQALLPNLQFLKNIFLAENRLIKALSKNPYILGHNLKKTLKPSVALWEGFGFHGQELVRLLFTCPGLLRITCWTPDRADLMHRIGINRGSQMHMYVVIIVATSRVETLKAKINNFQQCGLTAEETMELFRASPVVFGFSEEKVRQTMDFVVNNMEVPANMVVKHSSILHRSLDKCLKPRFLVLQKLKSMGGNTKFKSFHTILRMNDETFVSKIVMGHPESAILYALYQGALAEASSSTNISKKAWYFSAFDVLF